MPTIPLVLLDNLAILLCQSAMLARARLASHPSPVLRVTAQHDHVHADAELLRREVAVLRGQRAAMKPCLRPDYSPDQRWEITQITRLRGWTAIEAAEHFVLHPNTIRGWLNALNTGRGARLFAEAGVAWNRIHDGVRGAIHKMRSLCPHPEFGTRAMALHFLRASVQVSRSSIQRILREPEIPPEAPAPEAPSAKPAAKEPLIPPAGKDSYHLLKPTTINRAWHLDLTSIHVLWMNFTVAAIMDGHSRKLLRLRIYPKVPATRNLLALVGRSVRAHGKPRFLITDHGGQFQERFTAGLELLKIKHVRGRVRCPAMNGKIERFFRTFRGWLRVALLPINVRGLQNRLNSYQDWYNGSRPHSALKGRTPDEVWQGLQLPPAVPIHARDPVEVAIDIQRRSYAHDRGLPEIAINLSLQLKQVA